MDVHSGSGLDHREAAFGHLEIVDDLLKEAESDGPTAWFDAKLQARLEAARVHALIYVGDQVRDGFANLQGSVSEDTRGQR